MSAIPEIIPKTEPALRDNINKLAKELKTLIDSEASEWTKLNSLTDEAKKNISHEQIQALEDKRKEINARVDALNQNITAYNGLDDFTPIHDNRMHFGTLFPELDKLSLYTPESKKVANPLALYSSEYLTSLRLQATAAQPDQCQNLGDSTIAKPVVITASVPSVGVAQNANPAVSTPSILSPSPSGGVPIGAVAQTGDSSRCASHPHHRLLQVNPRQLQMQCNLCKFQMKIRKDLMS